MATASWESRHATDRSLLNRPIISLQTIPGPYRRRRRRRSAPQHSAPGRPSIVSCPALPCPVLSCTITRHCTALCCTALRCSYPQPGTRHNYPPTFASSPLYSHAGQSCLTLLSPHPHVHARLCLSPLAGASTSALPYPTRFSSPQLYSAPVSPLHILSTVPSLPAFHHRPPLDVVGTLPSPASSLSTVFSRD